jgi:membrane dipeptidase
MNIGTVISVLAVSVMAAQTVDAEVKKPDLASSANMIAQKYMLVDTHIDVPYRLEDKWEDVTEATADGDFDYPRARKGGLNVPFMSIYTPPESEEAGDSYAIANRLIDRVEALVGRAPKRFAVVKTSKQAEKAMKSGLIGLAMGMENGSPLDGNLDNVAFFKQRGISYITLTHGLSNHISDSSYDEEHQWNGLSPFGKEVVAEMNRQGIMIDISHVSDDAFWQVMELSEVPVIASHSSARHFTPGWERNMSDEMIKALAKNGGVIQINFGSSFLTEAAMNWYEEMDTARDAFLAEHGLAKESEEASAFGDSYRLENPLPFATMDEVVAHFQRVIEMVGVEHVGIGSDFDGVGDSLPLGLKEVADYPNLIEALLRLEYSIEDIAAIMGGNLMRVWRATEDFAAQEVAAVQANTSG